MKKKEALKARGIRFTEDTWKKLSKDAEKESSTPSDVVREIIKAHYKVEEENANT